METNKIYTKTEIVKKISANLIGVFTDDEIDISEDDCLQLTYQHLRSSYNKFKSKCTTGCKLIFGS